MQTSEGELAVDGYGYLGGNWGWNCPIVLSGGEYRPCDPRQLVGGGDDEHVAWGSGFKGGHPSTDRNPVSLRSQHDRACSMNQDLAQVPEPQPLEAPPSRLGRKLPVVQDCEGSPFPVRLSRSGLIR